jgi:hypothetical protein
MAWGEPIEEETLRKPLEEFQGCDILTDDTLLQIMNHNNKSDL